MVRQFMLFLVLILALRVFCYNVGSLDFLPPKKSTFLEAVDDRPLCRSPAVPLLIPIFISFHFILRLCYLTMNVKFLILREETVFVSQEFALNKTTGRQIFVAFVI